MRKAILSAASALFLGACSTPAPYKFDLSAVPEANKARLAGWLKCASELTDGPMVPLMECHNANNRAFLKAVRYQDNGAAEGYFDRLRLLAIDADAGRITKDEAYRRFAEIYLAAERQIGVR